jgi:hypothetical protein
MATETTSFFESLASRYFSARGFFARMTQFFDRVTFRVKRGTPQEMIDEVVQKWKLDQAQRDVLLGLASSKSGAAFIDEKVQDINRAAFHRSVFVLNAVTQLGFVDLAAQIYASLPLLKFLLVLANLCLVWIAHAALRQQIRAMLSGPNALPPKRIFWGLFRNPEYNRAIRKHSRPYARSAWLENSIFRPAYFLNAGTIFIGSQFILAPERLIFPFGLILGKISGLFSTLVMVFDVWRGLRAGDDAKKAQQREVSVYRDLDI